MNATLTSAVRVDGLTRRGHPLPDPAVISRVSLETEPSRALSRAFARTRNSVRFAEIAEARGVKENTTRLQATAIYSKAGLSGRAEFVAEIIQSLLLLLPDTKRVSQ